MRRSPQEVARTRCLPNDGADIATSACLVEQPAPPPSSSTPSRATASRIHDTTTLPLFREKAMWCAVMSATFLICYGVTLHLTAARAPVPTLALAWEEHVPFVPSLIIPYMSIDLFFLGSFFLCTRAVELQTHVKRLAFVIGIATACFLLFPMQMASHRPAVGGLWTAWFALLDRLDRPYNLAPSLHLAQWTVLWMIYGRHTRSWLKAVVAVWFVLIAASTLLTWQHHVFDVITGLVLGLLALCVFRDHRPSTEP